MSYLVSPFRASLVVAVVTFYCFSILSALKDCETTGQLCQVPGGNGLRGPSGACSGYVLNGCSDMYHTNAMGLLVASGECLPFQWIFHLAVAKHRGRAYFLQAFADQ